MPVDRSLVALALAEIATLLELAGENRFKAAAFRDAARAVERFEGDLGAAARTGRLERVRGIGRVTGRVVREMIETGESAYLRELRQVTPYGLRELLAVPGLGPERVRRLYETLGIESLEQLRLALDQGRLEGVPGFGERLREKLAAGADFVRGTAGRRLLGRALEPAVRLASAIRSVPGVERVEVAGEVRRGVETVGGIELTAAVPARQRDRVIALLSDLPGLARGEAEAEGAVITRLADGFGIRIRAVEPAAFGTAWILATGSPTHVAMLRARASAAAQRNAERGGVAAGGPHTAAVAPLRDRTSARSSGDEAEQLPLAAEEADVYAALGLPLIPPELREGRSELDLAGSGRLGDIVTEADVRGTFHCHTLYSDGRASVAAMAEAALERGWRYLGLADHSQAASYAGGMRGDALARQLDEIDAWNREHGDRLRLLAGIEADILSDGRVDLDTYDPALVERLDYVVGSVHSRFELDERAMTDRVLRALDDPRLSILGHPTGRRLLAREPYPLDLPRVIERAAERGVAIELNADPWRLDLDWRLLPDVVARGVPIAIGPDAHSAAALDNVALGVLMARKAALLKAQVMNTWSLEDVLEQFANSRIRQR